MSMLVCFGGQPLRMILSFDAVAVSIQDSSMRLVLTFVPSESVGQGLYQLYELISMGMIHIVIGLKLSSGYLCMLCSKRECIDQQLGE